VPVIPEPLKKWSRRLQPAHPALPLPGIVRRSPKAAAPGKTIGSLPPNSGRRLRFFRQLPPVRGATLGLKKKTG